MHAKTDVYIRISHLFQHFQLYIILPRLLQQLWNLWRFMETEKRTYLDTTVSLAHKIESEPVNYFIERKILELWRNVHTVAK